ncbi:hypothetical protein W97_04999 [Coniosporium apollinis CBS 100218]|uniref:RRM domain-containing protein n=1 Tax=Coniosporium apollinis (strain CBS 100218) TaxID=1168221 RepID=R7YV03_CONA1|nr:uncharacterized protein W97_04999 [Coniosporium apollinis CBS 100218]EON65760.1 hypothetical protein W97_04999 [Coniosporium apollinis CBS 100218]
MPARSAPPAKAPPGNPPNQTLYLSNLPDKLQKPDLRRALYMLFSTYGPVLDVVALKTSKMRGQAHVVFRDVQAASQAMRQLQGWEFFGKEMKIAYAKGKSDTIAKLDGTFKIPDVKTTATSSEVQQSIFNAPPSAAAASTTTAPATAPAQARSAEAAKPAQANGQAKAGTAAPPAASAAPAAAAADSAAPHGVKRGREDESDEEGAPMEEEDEDEAMMEESDSE